MDDTPFATPTPAGKVASLNKLWEARAPERAGGRPGLSRSSSTTSSRQSVGNEASSGSGMVRSCSSNSGLSSASYTSSAASTGSSPSSTPSRIPRFATPTRASTAARRHSCLPASDATGVLSQTASSSRRSLPFLFSSSSSPSLSRSQRTPTSSSDSSTSAASQPLPPPTHVPVRFRFSSTISFTLPVPVTSPHDHLLALARANFDLAQLAAQLPHHATATSWRLAAELRVANQELVIYQGDEVVALLEKAVRFPKTFGQVDVVVWAVGGNDQAGAGGDVLADPPEPASSSAPQIASSPAGHTDDASPPASVADPKEVEAGLAVTPISTSVPESHPQVTLDALFACAVMAALGVREADRHQEGRAAERPAQASRAGQPTANGMKIKSKNTVESCGLNGVDLYLTGALVVVLAWVAQEYYGLLSF